MPNNKDITTKILTMISPFNKFLKLFFNYMKGAYS